MRICLHFPAFRISKVYCARLSVNGMDFQGSIIGVPFDSSVALSFLVLVLLILNVHSLPEFQGFLRGLVLLIELLGVFLLRFCNL